MTLLDFLASLENVGTISDDVLVDGKARFVSNKNV